ncbi:MAG: shikimate dehydrogenase [Candidatus Eisenbacteria bacterium]|nr:shikimate dehydrogenase [Candidatus Eisenbacteria bacterium]
MSAPVRLAVLGDPLHYTLSPVLHRAGCAAVGVVCESEALRTRVDELPGRLADLAARGWLGCNLTHPLKESALDCAARASVAAERARSANTLVFREPGGYADSTDGPGFVDLLRELRHDPVRERVVLLGAGGAARSLALALHWAGCREVTVSARRPRDARFAWGEGLDERFLGWRSDEERDALAESTVIVNCTPLSAEEPPAPLERLARTALVVDLTYGPELTPWVKAARAQHLRAVDGLGLLVHQARRSLSLWLGREVPLEPLSAAVGWPR